MSDTISTVYEGDEQRARSEAGFDAWLQSIEFVNNNGVPMSQDTLPEDSSDDPDGDRGGA